jgi:hypothetical protein
VSLSTSQQPGGSVTLDASTPEALGPSHDGGGGLFGLTAWQVYGLIIIGALVIGAVTLLVPSTPSYDPWCWLVWGREILHGSLHTQGGASWKPLPVIFTTVFAFFGKAQPDMWIALARAGFVVTVVMSGKLAWRLTRWLSPEFGRPATREQTAFGRVAVLLPALLAAGLAISTVALTSGWISNSALGYSEAVATAALLIGLERHMDGHYRQAFALGLVAALDRPETWILWGPYGLWLMWRDRRARTVILLVVGLAILTLALWFVPQKLGGGSFTSGVTRATHVRANSAANASFPFWAEFKSAWTLAIFRMKIAALALIAGGLILLGYHWRTRKAATARVRLTPLQVKALSFAVLSGLFGFGWWVLIALETQAGFSGNSRYLTIGLANLDVAGAICYGALAIVLAELPKRWVPADRERLNLAQRTTLGFALLAAWFVAFPGWVGTNFIPLGAFHRSIAYQAGLRADVSYLIKTHGGPKGLQSCGAGRIMVEGFQVPMVAWYMHERTSDIEDQPSVGNPTGAWPNVIMQDRDTGSAALLPTFQQIDFWKSEGAHYTIVTTKEMRFFEDCSAQPDDPAVSTAS